MAPVFLLAALTAANVPGTATALADPGAGPAAAGQTPSGAVGGPAASVPGVPSAPPAGKPGGARGLVVVLQPEVQDDVTRNAMARITGELAAAPFTVVTQRVDPNGDIMSQVESAGRELGPVAAFAIAREQADRPGTVAVWVSNRITSTTTVQRVAIEADDVDGAAAHLAVEAVELVRASMAGLWPGTSKAPAGAVSLAPASVEARLQVGVGITVFRDFDAAPTFWAPAVAISYGYRDATRLRLSLEGLGPGTEVTATDGSGGARLERASARLGVVHAFRPGKTFEPLLSFAVGGQMLTAQGTGPAPARLHRQTAWSALAAAGAGALVALGSHLAIAVEAQLVGLAPDTVVRVGTTNVAHLEHLTFHAEVGLLATF